MKLKRVWHYCPEARVCLIVACVSIWILLELILERSRVAEFMLQIHRPTDPKGSKARFQPGFLVNTNGCRIPDLDPMDEAVRQYIFDERPVNCAREVGPALVESNQTSVYLVESALPHYGVARLDEISCCYRPFWRQEGDKNPSGNYSRDVDTIAKFAPDCMTFRGSVRIDHEFVKIICFVGGDPVYKDYHAFFPKKANHKHRQDINNGKNKVNVLVFGVDAVSRLNLYRQMPKTVEFLKQTLKAVDMMGYNKVEDNTFPNVVPVLTGLSVEELTKTCWRDTSHVFDDCDFIWNKFSDIGYTTVFGEDAPWMGIFNLYKRGFRKQPTDYYMRIFNQVAENDIGFDLRGNAFLCLGPRKNLESLIDYAKKFLISMKETLTFAFIWGSSLSHDYLNLPKQGDENHREFLKTLHDNGILNDTVLVFMSDHGIRCGDIRKTYQGYLEERLPFLFIAYPDRFRLRYTTAVGNLKTNSRRLTTPFDLHELLVDLTDPTRLERDALRRRSDELAAARVPPRGISLFLPVPGRRTCADAGVVDHWCTCHQSKEVPVNGSAVREAAVQLVRHVNLLLRGYPQCAPLRLATVLLAREERSASHSSWDRPASIDHLTVTVRTTPGDGLFEGTLRRVGRGEFSVAGTVSRINLYGDQSACMPSYKLRLYCYCDH